MRQLITLCLLSALVLLTACGGINASEKSQASSATGTRTSASTSSAVTTATGTSTQQVANAQFGTLSIDASGLTYYVGQGSQLFVTVTPIDQNPNDRRELVVALPASLPLTIAKLAVKSYKLSLLMSDPVGNRRLTAESEVVAVSAGAANSLKIYFVEPSCNLSGPCETAFTIRELVSTPVVQASVASNPIVDNGQFEFVRDYGCVPVERMLTCKDGSVPSEKIANERCRAKSACATKGESCVFSRMVCPDGSLAEGSFATIDMSCQPKGTDHIGGMCKSSAQSKREIHYLTTAERQQLSDAILNTKLSKYFYKDGVAHDRSRQLGFIIEDQPADSIFVNDDKTHVNFYAFTSGAVAAIQQLKDELAQQQATIKQLKDELEQVRKKAN